MQTLINWSAKRAGAGITITGVDRASGRPVKITNVMEILANASGCRAYSQDNTVALESR